MGKYLITNPQRANVEVKIYERLADLKAIICFDGGTGRRRGLKHHCRKGVRVQVPLEAPTLICGVSQAYRVDIYDAWSHKRLKLAEQLRGQENAIGESQVTDNSQNLGVLSRTKKEKSDNPIWNCCCVLPIVRIKEIGNSSKCSRRSAYNQHYNMVSGLIVADKGWCPNDVYGSLAQKSRALPCHGKGHGFKPRTNRHSLLAKE